MDSQQTSGSRKRGRSSDEHTNGSSPLPNTPATSSSKRRKLGDLGSSPSTTKALKVLKSALTPFSGVFGLGRANNTTSTQESKEAEPTTTEAPDNSNDENGIQGDEESHLILDSASKSKTRGSRLIAKSHLVASTSPASKRRHKGQIESNDEVENNGDRGIQGADEDTLKDSVIPTKKKLKRPSRAILAKTVEEEAVDEGTTEQPDSGTGAEGNGRSSGRQRRKPRRYSLELAETIKSGPKSILTPSKKNEDKSRKSVAFEVGNSGQDEIDLGFKDIPMHDTPKTASSGKTKRSQTPKKRKPTESTKDVGDDIDNEATLSPHVSNHSEPQLETTKPGSKSTPKAPKTSTKVAQKTLPIEELELAEDDVSCVICGQEDSEEPNEIILCDNCDLAVHQECYGVPAIPDGDWFCHDCRPEEDVEEDPELGLVDQDEDAGLELEFIDEPMLNIDVPNTPDIKNLESHLRITQKLLLDKLTGRKRLKLQGLDEEFHKVYQVVEQTVLAGEGNSMLVLGARGSGKTTLVEKVIADLSEENRENFHVVRLNGFVHTDDKLALRETWRQLGREMEVDDDLTSKTNNYADTLASLLALLSHPSEISQDQADQTAKSVIFVLDEFDLFATHPRQTLLYNLFDIAQSRKAPIAVLGLTAKIDVVESLEKRVKSRFSHRYVHLPLPRSVAAYWEICRQGLLVTLSELEEEGLDPRIQGQEEFLKFWETLIDELYHKDDLFKIHLQMLFYRNKSIPAFFTTCILPIASLTPRSLPLTSSSFFSNSIPNLSPPDSKLHLLQGLSELDLALLICAARLDIVLDTDTCNFAMAYDEYCTLTSKHKIQTSSTGVAALGAGAKVWGREVATGSWERLIEYELLLPASMGAGPIGGLGGGGVGREGKMWKVDVGLEEIPGSVDGLSAVMRKWCTEI